MTIGARKLLKSSMRNAVDFDQLAAPGLLRCPTTCLQGLLCLPSEPLLLTMSAPSNGCS